MGLFSAFMHNHYHFYLLAYLNALIHRLLTAQNKFTSYLLTAHLEIPNVRIEQVIAACET